MQYYTIEEVSLALKVSRRTIQRALKKGDLTGARIGKLWRFTAEDIHVWITPPTTPPTKP